MCEVVYLTSQGPLIDQQAIFIGKLMSVSLVAHNAFDNNVYLTGQFNNLSTSYYNTSTINLNINLWHTTTSITNIVNTCLVNLNTSVNNINLCVQNISRNYWYSNASLLQIN